MWKALGNEYEKDRSFQKCLELFSFADCIYVAHHHRCVTTAFSAAGSQVWNYLPTDLGHPDLRYRQSLKTFLLGQCHQITVRIRSPCSNCTLEMLLLTYFCLPECSYSV